MNHRAPKVKPIYPPDWPRIAYEIKQARGWKCEICGMTQGEELNNNITVHHKDHNIFNSDPSNLQVLCQKCHLRIEGSYHRLNHRQEQINLLLSQGQKILPGFTNILSSTIKYSRAIPLTLLEEPGIAPTDRYRVEVVKLPSSPR